MPDIVLYDFAWRHEPNRCWSYNVLKTRLVLNYKGIPFTTAWVDHDTLKPTLQSIGVPPNTSGQGFEYSVPTVKFTDGSIIMDSAAIASKLEALYPSPSLHLDSALQAEAESIVHDIVMSLFAVYFPRVTREVIRESTIPKFTAPREQLVGMSLEQLEKTRGGQQAWDAAEPGFQAMKELLNSRKVDEGPFIHGSQVCYADFIFVAVFEAVKKVDDEMLDMAISRDPSLAKLYEASQAWLRNDR